MATKKGKSNSEMSMPADSIDKEAELGNTCNLDAQEISAAAAATPKDCVTYKTYFKYTKNTANEKIGLCLLCKNGGLTKEVKMKNSNTSGLKFHLSKDHKREYHILFGSPVMKTPSISQDQKTMDLFAKVSVLLNIIFYIFSK